MFHPLSSSVTSKYAALGDKMSYLIDVAFSIYMQILQVALSHYYLVVFSHLFISRLKNVILIKKNLKKDALFECWQTF